MQKRYPWFEQISHNLQKSFERERLAHGLLLSSPAMSGKYAFAQSIAKSLLCLSRLSIDEPCSQCKSCLLFEAESHPDFYLVDCLLDNKGVQKKSIGIDQIRKLNSKLVDSAQMGGWKTVLVKSISAMTTAAFNALLKTLEEPRDKTLILLLTDNLAKVPATVRSRCQIITPTFNDEILINWLKQHSKKSQQQIEFALKACYYAPLAAKEFLIADGEIIQKQQFSLFDQVLSNQITPTELFAQISIADDELPLVLANYLYQVRVQMLEGQNHNSRYQALPSKIIFQLYSKVLEYNRAQHSGSNLQTKLQIEAILIQWFEIGRKIGHYSNA